MSGLYNMVMGVNPLLKTLVEFAFLEVDEDDNVHFMFPEDSDLGRVRDAWIIQKEGEPLQIGILHRNYSEDKRLIEPYTAKAMQSPNYVGYHSCEDETYAWWVFNMPKDEEIQGLIHSIAEKASNWITRHPMDHYMEVINNMGDPDKQNDPDVMRAMSAGEQIMGALNDSIQSGEAKEATTPTGSVVCGPVSEEQDDTVNGEDSPGD